MKNKKVKKPNKNIKFMSFNNIVKKEGFYVSSDFCEGICFRVTHKLNKKMVDICTYKKGNSLSSPKSVCKAIIYGYTKKWKYYKINNTNQLFS
jgi:hypothetical protein